MTNLLEIQGLNTFYGESHILRNVDLSVKSGEMVCLSAAMVWAKPPLSLIHI